MWHHSVMQVAAFKTEAQVSTGCYLGYLLFCCSPCLPFHFLCSVVWCKVVVVVGCWAKLEELMKTNGCHFKYFPSCCTGPITKPDMEFSSRPTWSSVKTLHLCFRFFILQDCDVGTYGSTVPRGIMCRIWQHIAPWELPCRVRNLFPTGPTNAKRNMCFWRILDKTFHQYQ